MSLYYKVQFCLHYLSHTSYLSLIQMVLFWVFLGLFFGAFINTMCHTASKKCYLRWMCEYDPGEDCKFHFWLNYIFKSRCIVGRWVTSWFWPLTFSHKTFSPPLTCKIPAEIYNARCFEWLVSYRVVYLLLNYKKNQKQIKLYWIQAKSANIYLYYIQWCLKVCQPTRMFYISA